MAVLSSRIDAASREFIANREAMGNAVADLSDRLAAIRRGGGGAARKRHTERGKLLPRARIEALLDKGAEFFEFPAFAAHGVYEDAVPAAGIITGIGAVAGRDC